MWSGRRRGGSCRAATSTWSTSKTRCCSCTRRVRTLSLHLPMTLAAIARLHACHFQGVGSRDAGWHACTIGAACAGIVDLIQSTVQTQCSPMMQRPAAGHLALTYQMVLSNQVLLVIGIGSAMQKAC